MPIAYPNLLGTLATIPWKARPGLATVRPVVLITGYRGGYLIVEPVDTGPSVYLGPKWARLKSLSVRPSSARSILCRSGCPMRARSGAYKCRCYVCIREPEMRAAARLMAIQTARPDGISRLHSLGEVFFILSRQRES